MIIGYSIVKERGTTAVLDAKINTLLRVIDEGSYTAAAKKLALTQPAVSHHIQMLEQKYGIQIFYKNKKKLVLTPEGLILEKYARRAWAVSAAADQALKDSRKNIKHLTIAITPTVGENLLPQVIATYCNRHPNMHINIITDTINTIDNMLHTFAADIAIIEGDIYGPSFVSVLLDTDYLCLVVSPQHRFAQRSSVGLEELKSEKFILRSQSAGTRRLFESYLQGHFESIQNFNVIIQIDNVATIKELVALNLGVSVIGHSACVEEERTGRLAVVPIENASMARKINMVHRKEFSHTEILEELRSIYNAIQAGQSDLAVGLEGLPPAPPM